MNPPHTNWTNLLTTAEVASYLGVSRQRIHAMIKQEQLTPVNISGRCCYFLRDKIEELRRDREE
jgi:excisionase family DNA binding protein